MTRSLEQTATSLLAGGGQPRPEELAELYERATPSLVAWARLQLTSGLQRRIDAEELVQETWTRALHALPGFDADQGPFRAWLIGIGRNVLLEALRTCSREDSGLAAAGSAFALANCPDSVTSITQRVARSDALQHFADAMAALDEPERVLVACCGLERLGPEEAARRLGVSTAAAAKRWQRLRRQLLQRPQLLALLEE